MFYRITLYLIAICALSGCVANKVSQKGIDAVQRGEKALVIIPCDSPVSGLFNHMHNVSCATNWQRGETEEYLNQERHNSIYVVNPGSYHLRSVQIITSVDQYGNTSEYSAGNIHNIAQFVVSGGDVVYLGNIDLDLAKSKVVSEMVSINDQYDNARTMMAKENPMLLNKLEKRLITLSSKNLSNRVKFSR